MSCTIEKDTIIEMNTLYGSIYVKLFVKEAPTTCNNFLKYIDEHRYKDFHFYRKDCNTEFWSHKPGAAAVTKKDASGNFILDPKFSNRNFPNHNYYKFCSYYCVPNKTDIYEATKKELKMK